MTLTLPWALYFATRRMRLPEHNDITAVIVEVNLEKIDGKIIDISNIASAQKNRLKNVFPDMVLSRAITASEVLVENIIPKEALTGRYWMIRKGTEAGDKVLSTVGGDHRWPNPATGKYEFGGYARWLSEGFDKIAYTKAKEAQLFASLLEKDRKQEHVSGSRRTNSVYARR